MKVSVILPVYNVENYIRECLESLAKQTLGEFEIIAINDGSTDESLQILEEFKNSRINLKIINQENKGLSFARNAGIDNASGEYIFFLDSDDMIREDALQILYDLAHKDQLDLVIYDALRVDEISGNVDRKTYSRKGIFNNDILNKDEFMKGVIKKGLLHTPFHFYKREFIIKNKLKFDDGILHEDEIFSIKTYQYVERIGYCNQQLYIRRYRANSIMSNSIYQNIKSLNSYKYVLQEFEKIKKSNLHNDSFVKLINYRGTMILSNLIRYNGVTLRKLRIYSENVDFKLNYFRIIANIVIYKIKFSNW